MNKGNKCGLALKTNAIDMASNVLVFVFYK